MNDKRLPFVVVKGLEGNILEKKYNEGWVYFATDTKKIYLDAQDERLSMGGNTGIYYASVEQPEDDLEYFFKVSDIDEGKTPNVKDLILNTDGCFYKVEEVYSDGETIKTTKLTLAGGGGGNGPASLAGLTFDFLDFAPNSFKTTLAGRSFPLRFNFYAKDSTGALTGPGRYELRVNGALKKTGPVQEGENTLELKDLFNIVGDYNIEIKCFGDIGGAQDTSRTRKFSVKSTYFSINWDYDETSVFNLSRSFLMSWSISVESERKTSYIIIDDKYAFDTADTTYTFTPAVLRDLGLGHGTHKVELYTEAYIGDDILPTSSEHIINNVMFYDDMSPVDPGPIINCKLYKTQMNQYDTIQVPVMIYYPPNISGTATITMKVNGVEKAPQTNCKNLTYYNFSYTPVESGFILLTFTCGAAEQNFTIDVAALPMSITEVPGYAFKFKATEFTNNEEIINWTFKNESGIDQNIEFSPDFDWINGGLKTGVDDVGPYFKIQAGSYITIPYKIFNNDLKTRGANFKMIFKAHNCRDYDASILNCTNIERSEKTVDKKDENGNIIYKEDGEPETEIVVTYVPLGISLNAQGANIKSLTNGLDVRYCEDTYIEYGFDVCKYNSNKTEDQYLTVWLDGIPASVTKLSGTDSFLQSTAKDLTIGSEDCDIYLYLLKFYQKHLSFDQQLANFVMDAPSSEEMTARYHRNNILTKDNLGNEYISPELLAEKNPDCNVFIYDIPYIPTSKDDIYVSEADGTVNKKCCTFTHLKGGKEAIRYYDKVSLRAQGTSSMSYGISAYNLDAKFPEAWSINEHSIPVNYMNTKVNVASCEGANNALNQEWYNRYQPYKSQKRLQARSDGKLARDTMEFINGVVFLKDNNTTANSDKATSNNVFKEIPGYVKAPYPRMYSIGNMGNAKKNVEVFHGAGNQYECCVENADNNTSAQRMLIIGGFIPGHGQEGDPDYTKERDIDILFPDDVLDPSDENYENLRVFDDNGYVIPGRDWGKTYDEETDQYLDNKTLWKDALIGEGWFEFRYCVDEEDFVPDGKFAEFTDYEAYQWELSNRYLRLVRWLARNNPYLATNEDLPEAVTFDDYTIKGVKATAYSNYNSDDEILKGVSVPGGTYTKDTAAYRVAKMLRESENYLILDSIIYHYLFIERHTMVDNVAKNTFWTTEDGIHWELTKDYDNDTADGVDNSGHLIFDYGVEIMDNDENDADIFNARPSAWLHFAHGLTTLREKMYQELEKIGAWKAETYLNLFENWQNAIPEICWIEDFNRKYFRPSNVYGDTSYLKRLASGKKTHQRKQYEVYQEQYMNSEYKTSAGEGSLIQWRSKQPEAASSDGKYTIEGSVKMYADGYFVAAIASGAGEASAINLHIRGKKGETIHFSKTQATNFNDATCYVYSPNLYSEFTGVESLYPSYFTAVAANKLRLFSLDPKTDTQKNVFKGPLSVGENIENLIVRDCTAIAEENGDLDLTGRSRLKSVNTLGSNFSSFTIADGAPLTEFQVQNPFALSMSNLRYLNKDLFNINGYGSLRKIIFDNIDHNGVSSKNIVEEISSKEAIEYELKNINWVLDKASDVSENNIPILDCLISKGHPVGTHTDALGNVTNATAAESLTGTITITEEAYSGSNPLELYLKYGLVSENDTTFPNVDFVFEKSDGTPALATVTILNGNGEPRWVRKYANFNSISNDDLSNSSLGAFNAQDTILKTPSNQYTFTFNNRWKYTIVSSGTTGYISGDVAFDDTFGLDLSVISGVTNGTASDIIVEPDYATATRYYTVSFYGEDQETAEYVVHDAEYGASFASIAPQVIFGKDDSELPLERTYRLKGFSVLKGRPTLVNTDYWKVGGDTDFYAVFEEVNVRDVDYSDYLIIDEDGVLKGLAMDEWKNPLYQGHKIVIPNKVTSIGPYAFYYSESITKVFTSSNKFKAIGTSAFEGSNLEYFDFDHCGIETIETKAFQDTALSANDYGNVLVLPSNLQTIGMFAFSGGGDANKMFKGSEGFTIQIPSSIKTLFPYCFSVYDTASNVIVKIGSMEQPVTNLDLTQALDLPVFGSNANSDSPNEGITSIIIYSSTYTKDTSISSGTTTKTLISVLIGESKFISISFPMKEG